MKITLAEVVSCNKALEILSKKHYKNFSIALKIAHLKKKLADESEFYMQQERNIVDRYAEKQEDGNIKVTNGNISFESKENVIRFSEELNELKTTMVEVGDPIKIIIKNDFVADQTLLTPDEILALSTVIDFEEDESVK